MRVLFARVDTQVAATWGMWRTGVVMAAVGLLGFQAFHVLEHGIQIGYWFGHPQAAPFLTPWAVVGRDVLAAPLGRGPARGAELLHLVGNLLFLGGLLLLAAVWRYGGRSAGLRTEYGVRRLRWATWGAPAPPRCRPSLGTRCDASSPRASRRGSSHSARRRPGSTWRSVRLSSLSAPTSGC